MSLFGAVAAATELWWDIQHGGMAQKGNDKSICVLGTVPSTTY